jgi:hypothetical protein
MQRMRLTRRYIAGDEADIERSAVQPQRGEAQRAGIARRQQQREGSPGCGAVAIRAIPVAVAAAIAITRRSPTSRIGLVPLPGMAGAGWHPGAANASITGEVSGYGKFISSPNGTSRHLSS